MRIESWKGRGVSDADFTLTPTRLSSNTLQLLLSNTDENITKKVQNNTSGPVHSSDYSSGGLIWRSSPPFESWRSSSNQVWYKCSRDQLGVSHQLCLLPRHYQHDAASYSFHPRLPWSRYLIIDVDEIKAYIILHNYTDHKTRWYTSEIMFPISTEQPQQIKTKGGDEIQLPVEGEVYLWSVLEENIWEREAIVFPRSRWWTWLQHGPLYLPTRVHTGEER